MHPLKSLNVMGDGGMVVTNNKKIAEWLRKFRNHGMVDRDHIDFWGVRGSVPSPGPNTTRYGGNTSCVSITVDNKILILDAGTGIRNLGSSIISKPE